MRPKHSISRREFLRWVSLAAGGLSVSLHAAPSSRSRHELGCYTRCFDQFDYKTALDGIAEAGFSHAGIMTAKGPSWVIVTPDTSPEEAAAIGDETTRRGLKMISLYSDFGSQAGQSADAAVKALSRLIENCKACGSPHLLLGGTNDEKIFDNYYKAVAECCPRAAEAGITLSIKPHGGQNSNGPQCRRIIEKVGQQNFRLWYDPGNIFYYSDGKLDPVEDSATVDGLVCGVSIKDYQPPKEVLITPGDGIVDFRKVLRRLRKGGFKSGPLVVECVKRGELKSVIAEAQKARRLLEEILSELS